jgi:hypothetical protein
VRRGCHECSVSRTCGEAGIRLDSAKVDGLASLVLGLANYFRDFVPGFSLKAVRMEELLSRRFPLCGLRFIRRSFRS